MADSRAKRRKAADGKVPVRPWLPLAVAFAALVGAGCLPAPGAYNTVYVLLPYAVATVAAALCGFALLGDEARSARAIQKGKRRLVPRLKTCAILGLVASVMTAVGETLHVLIFGLALPNSYEGAQVVASQGSVWAVVAYVALMAVAAAAFGYLRRFGQ